MSKSLKNKMCNDQELVLEKISCEAKTLEKSNEIDLEPKSDVSVENTIKRITAVVPIETSQVTKEKILNANLGKSSDSPNVDTVEHLSDYEVLNGKAQGAKVGDSSKPLKESVETLVKMLGKPYVKRKRRKRYPGETEEQRAKRLEIANIRLALKKHSMNEKEREELRKRNRLLYKLRRAHETPEERAKRLASKRLRFHNMSEEQRALRNAKIKEKRAAGLAKETPEQRQERYDKMRLKGKTLSLEALEAYRKRARERFRNLSETEKEDLLVRRRARDRLRRNRVALAKQQMLEKQKTLLVESSPAPTNLSQAVKYSGPIKHFLLSEITVEPPDIPDSSFYDYVYNEIQPFMMHLNGNSSSETRKFK